VPEPAPEPDRPEPLRIRFATYNVRTSNLNNAAWGDRHVGWDANDGARMERIADEIADQELTVVAAQEMRGNERNAVLARLRDRHDQRSGTARPGTPWFYSAHFAARAVMQGRKSAPRPRAPRCDRSASTRSAAIDPSCLAATSTRSRAAPSATSSAPPTSCATPATPPTDGRTTAARRSTATRAPRDGSSAL